MSDQKSEKKYRNLSKKYKIDRDDFEAQFERLTRYILQTYNFGSELVTIAYLDLLRNGDIPESAEGKKASGMYRREIGEEGKGAEKAIGKPSELIAESIRARAEQAQKGEQEKASGAANEKGVKEKPLKSSIREARPSRVAKKGRSAKKIKTERKAAKNGIQIVHCMR